MGRYRIGFLMRWNFQMKLSLIVGLVEAVPQLAPLPCSTDALFLLGYWGYVKDTVYSMPVPDINTLKTQVQDAILAITGEILANTLAEIK